MKKNNIAIFFLSLVDINPETLQPDIVPCWTREREECRTGWKGEVQHHGRICGPCLWQLWNRPSWY